MKKRISIILVILILVLSGCKENNEENSDISDKCEASPISSSSEKLNEEMDTLQLLNTEMSDQEELKKRFDFSPEIKIYIDDIECPEIGVSDVSTDKIVQTIRNYYELECMNSDSEYITISSIDIHKYSGETAVYAVAKDEATDWPMNYFNLFLFCDDKLQTHIDGCNEISFKAVKGFENHIIEIYSSTHMGNYGLEMYTVVHDNLMELGDIFLGFRSGVDFSLEDYINAYGWIVPDYNGGRFLHIRQRNKVEPKYEDINNDGYEDFYIDWFDDLYLDDVEDHNIIRSTYYKITYMYNTEKMQYIEDDERFIKDVLMEKIPFEIDITKIQNSD